MSLNWHRQQYEAKIAVIEAKYKKFAAIWHAKGRKAFSNALEHGIPNWNDFFEEEWAKFTIIKLKCPKCEHIKDFKVDFEKDDINVFEELNGLLTLMCLSCGNMIGIDEWEVIE